MDRVAKRTSRGTRNCDTQVLAFDHFRSACLFSAFESDLKTRDNVLEILLIENIRTGLERDIQSDAGCGILESVLFAGLYERRIANVTFNQIPKSFSRPTVGMVDPKFGVTLQPSAMQRGRKMLR